MHVRPNVPESGWLYVSESRTMASRHQDLPCFIWSQLQYSRGLLRWSVYLSGIRGTKMLICFNINPGIDDPLKAAVIKILLL